MEGLIFILFFISVIFIGGMLALKFLAQYQKPEEKLPYAIKYRLFSRSEMVFLQLLEKNLDHTKYTIFPKVRLADFIEVTAPKEEFQKWFNKIKSKHIDFLVWDINEHKIALAIELDGNSHNTEKMKERDEFVNKLYETVGIKLERIRVGDDFEGEIRRVMTELSY